MPSEIQCINAWTIACRFGYKPKDTNQQLLFSIAMLTDKVANTNSYKGCCVTALVGCQLLICPSIFGRLLVYRDGLGRKKGPSCLQGTVFGTNWGLPCTDYYCYLNTWKKDTFLPLSPLVQVSVLTIEAFSEERNILSVWQHPKTSEYTGQHLNKDNKDYRTERWPCKSHRGEECLDRVDKVGKVGNSDTFYHFMFDN